MWLTVLAHVLYYQFGITYVYIYVFRSWNKNIVDALELGSMRGTINSSPSPKYLSWELTWVDETIPIILLMWHLFMSVGLGYFFPRAHTCTQWMRVSAYEWYSVGGDFRKSSRGQVSFLILRLRDTYSRIVQGIERKASRDTRKKGLERLSRTARVGSRCSFRDQDKQAARWLEQTRVAALIQPLGIE